MSVLKASFGSSVARDVASKYFRGNILKGFLEFVIGLCLIYGNGYLLSSPLAGDI
jgi:hypothetical protein